MPRVLTRAVTDVYLALALVWLGSAAYYGLTRPHRRIRRRSRADAVWPFLVAALFIALWVTRPRWLAGVASLFGREFFVWPLAGLGLLLVAAGFVLAVWARFTLGEFWSSSAVVKEGQELIQHGPFAIVRHPIYVGIGSMLVGAVLVTGSPGWAIVALVSLSYFAWKATIEERLMRDQFREQWLAYRARVGAVLPRGRRPGKR